MHSPIRTICLGLFSLPFCLSGKAQPNDSQQIQTVCEIVFHPDRFDGRSVVVESTIVADRHATVLEGLGCGKGIYLSFDSNHSSPVWKKLESAVAAKRSGLDKRVLRVKIRGNYHSRLQDGKRRIRQLEATEVLEVNFENTI